MLVFYFAKRMKEKSIVHVSSTCNTEDIIYEFSFGKFNTD